MGWGFSENDAYFKNLASGAYIKYLRDDTDDFKTNPKRMWSFLKCFSKKAGVAPMLKDGATNVT